ncbi:hypothetical protein [Psychroserpens sp.]|uniref:hypothetical protein n=1 Tax=Psychroserpens sp. TaxID=2020870 RepID=UPI001B0E8E35|nr:hypothetical protein [Psychroserpens sp.]MBO6605754.1 hypothetical protein [Psychroserpens sp.]MBO6630124.1 hypothetical protein [Psychroserpens sp.]MBO6652875.1 hypothetical protein [Psychroserpens sp.]MBO6681353.1 hypothetical protein [Psychroserpens sp.]MBO6749128.1 hypothetical protein [Psychroserpens sp.]
MKLNSLLLFIISFLLISCGIGKLKFVADLPNSLKETSAIEKLNGSDLLWVIEDAGNKNNLYGLNENGQIIKDIDIDNVQNIDWEDLTSDNDGNIYIGDFGNNSKKRKRYAIYKVHKPHLAESQTDAEVITFELPKDFKSMDFESFFLLDDQFFIFSKSDKHCRLFTLPNVIGHHEAQFNSEVKWKGKHNKVTSAAISPDGRSIVLLNHDKLWRITQFSPKNIMNGNMVSIPFEHNSQKEGIYFLNNKTVLITDEQVKGEGGNIYRFELPKHLEVKSKSE